MDPTEKPIPTLSPYGSEATLTENRDAPSLKDASLKHLPQSELSPVEVIEEPERLSGWRLWGTTFTYAFLNSIQLTSTDRNRSCQLCVFLANLEVAIVSTTLVDITDSLRAFDRSSWIITSYLLTYTGFLSIWSKLSDSLGRRQCLCASIVIFTIASGACGGAQTAEQLIIFRAFQGVGGSGLLSLNFVILPEMVEPKRYALWGAFTSSSFVLGFLLGPLLGGAIVESTTWRWVFLINLPLGVLALVLIVVFMPVGFPDLKAKSGRLNLGRLAEIDVFCAILIFGACAFLVSALEETGLTYAWSSPVIIVLLVLAALFAIILPFWELRVDRGIGKVQPIFTGRLMRHRVFMSELLISFFAGVNFTASVIQIPQQWQTVFEVSPLVAGVRLLPFTLFYSTGTVVAMILTSKMQIPPIFVILEGAILQVIATSVISFVPLGGGAGKYVCDCVLGLGVGQNLGIIVQMTPQLIRGKDQAAAMGAITQFRALGGVVGFAITTNVFNASIKAKLAGVLDASQLQHLLESVTEAIASLAPDVRRVVLETFAKAYDLEVMILLAFSAAQILSLGLMWEGKMRRLI